LTSSIVSEPATLTVVASARSREASGEVVLDLADDLLGMSSSATMPTVPPYLHYVERAEEMGTSLPQDDARTLAGSSSTGWNARPEPGDEVEAGDAVLAAERTDSARISDCSCALHSPPPDVHPTAQPSSAQYHLPFAKPPNATSPTRAMTRPIQKLHTIMSTIPTITRIPPRPMPPVLPPVPRSAATAVSLARQDRGLRAILC
jgi:hypothetical protein